MRYFQNCFCLFIFMLLGIGCKRTVNGTGAIVSETRDLNQATEITLSIPAEVTIIEADSFSCVIGTQKNILNVINTKVNGNEFSIESDHDFNTDKPVQIVISLPKIEAIEVNGSGQVSSLNNLQDKVLKLEVNGSGTIKLSGKIIDIESAINGSGEIYLDGKCDQQKVNINGSGNFHGYGFETANSKIEITGSGDAEVMATDELKVDITGSGNVHYKGNPHLKSDITGSGNVQKN